MKTTIIICTLICAVSCGLAAEPAPPATPKPLAPMGAQTGTRRISFKARVDTSDDIVIQNGKLHIEHMNLERPIEITINGRKWKPTWTENRTDEFAGFSPALAPFAGATITVKQTKGRGETIIKEQPTEANGQKLVVRMHDGGNGASDFEVHITW
jgi:hypothetical protein